MSCTLLRTLATIKRALSAFVLCNYNYETIIILYNL
jgi:hypothetical protein